MMQALKTVILAQLTLLLMTSVSPLAANAAAPGLASFPPEQRDAIAVQCDRLADSPYDTQRVGPGVPIDQINVAEALPVCQRAAARLPARPRYQYLYGRVLDAAKRYDEAVQQYAAADQAGNPWGSVSLGSLYANGDGVAKDPAKAATFLRRAGDGGLPDAYADLGLLYAAANPPNYTQAFSEFDRASRAGSTLALAYLGEFYFNGLGVVKNQTRALALFQQAANRGDPEGMLDLGLSYYSGTGVRRDPATALRWLSRAAEFGFAQAQDVIGYMYQEGDGVGQSDEQAMAWYRKSAAQDDPFAMTHLARLLIDAGNDAEATAWYRRAAALGDPTGMTKLGDLLAEAGNGAEAVDWYRKAAAKGFVDVETRLADAYRMGKNGIPQDYPQAAFWYSKAVEQGDTFAMVRLGELYEKGLGVVQSTEKARQLYTRAADDPQIPGMQARYNLAHLDGAPTPAPSDNAPGSGDLISGGIITPPPGYAPAPGPPPPPPPRNSVPQDSSGQRDNTREPPRRPLPTQRAHSDDENVKAMLILGAIVIGGAWLLSGSSGSSSGVSSDAVPSGGGGWGGGGGTSPTPPSSRPVSTPMNGDITRTLHGADALGINGPVNRR